VVLVAGTGVLLTFIYGDEIKQYAVKQLNSYLNTEIQVKEIDFSVFRKFPDATIILHSVVVKSSNTFNKKDFRINTDTLLVARTLYLQFDLWKALHKQYELKAIHLDSAKAHLYCDKTGKNNYSVFKKSQTSGTDSINIKLEELKFTDTDVKFLNAEQQLELSISTKDFKLSGDFYKNEYTLKTKGELSLNKLIVQKVNYLKTHEAKINISLDVHNGTYTIHNGNVQLGKIDLAVSGLYQTNDEADEVQLTISGNKQSIKDFIKSLPDKYASYFEHISADGYLDFKAKINGAISYKINPRIKINFNILDANLENSKTNTALHQLILKGSFDNGLKQSLESTSFTIDTFHTQINDSIFCGRFSIYNFNAPQVKFEVKGGLNLSEWKSLLNLDTFSVLKGNVSLSLNYFGRLKDLSKITSDDYRRALVKGYMKINDVSFQVNGNPYLIEHLKGAFIFHNNDVQTESATLQVNNTSLLVKGYLRNLISYLMLPGEKLDATLQLNINKLNANDWLSKNKSNAAFGFPDDMHIIADVTLDEFDYNKFQAKQMKSFFELKKPALYFSNLSFNSIEGTFLVNGKLLVDQNKNLILQSDAKLTNLNIKKLFQTFDNFGQTFLQDKHIQGKLKADIPFIQLKWDSAFHVVNKDIVLDANIEIDNGQLSNFEPLYNLADYISLNDLRQIKFSTLKNDISIKDRKIIIPNMEIHSSAFNIEVSGEHTFDNVIEYRIKLLMSEWLASKARKNKKENLEFGIEENDGLGSTSLYLTIKGTVDKYKITYDSKKMKEQVKQSLKKETLELKSVLNQELGLFKKDTAFINQQKKQEEVKKSKFKIEWDEDNPEKDKSE
jgi:hypothetical protein